MTEYVCGFAFDETQKRVSLILKNRPVFLAGKYNGIGGKLEDSDVDVFHAMAREFEEECGVKTSPSQWNSIGVLTSPYMKVTFLHTVLSNSEFEKIATQEDEMVFQMPVHNLRNVNLDIDAAGFLNAIIRGNVEYMQVDLR